MRVETTAQQLLFCTSLIQTVTSAGTGFVWSAQSGQNEVPVLITNKHVAMKHEPGSFSLAAGDRAGGVKLGERVDFAHADFASLWTGHPNPQVDIAACFLGPLINNAVAAGNSLFFRSVADDICPSDQVVIEDLDVVEPVTFVGYPNALFDKINLTPISRRGHTATPVALDYNGLPSFLIDASVFPGSSGSPVFIHQENGFKSGDSFQLGASRLLFVGIVAAVHVQQDTGQLVTAQSLPHIQLNQLMDLGIVYNWRAVRETVQSLFAAHGVPYGAAPSATTVGTGVNITTQDEPPERPQDDPT